MEIITTVGRKACMKCLLVYSCVPCAQAQQHSSTTCGTSVTCEVLTCCSISPTSKLFVVRNKIKDQSAPRFSRTRAWGAVWIRPAVPRCSYLASSTLAPALHGSPWHRSLRVLSVLCAGARFVAWKHTRINNAPKYPATPRRTSRSI